MDRRRFFMNRTLTESVVSESQKRNLFEDTMAELNRLYEEDEQDKSTNDPATADSDTASTKESEPEAAPADDNKSDSAEAKEILADLKDSSYEKFVEILNSDGKSKAFLDYLQQHYKLGDDAIQTVKASKAAEGTVKCSQLVPTQQNISVEKSLGMVGSGDGWAVKIINTPEAAFNDPTITYAGKYIIDGHHRWSKAYALNGGDCTIKVLNFPAIEGMSWQDMLKATQLAIVANNPGVGLVNKVPDDNMLGTGGADMAAKLYIEKADDDVVAAMKEKGRGDTKEAQAETIKKNIAQMVSTSSPVEGAAPRAVMPQTDKAPGATDDMGKAVIDLT